MSEADRLWTTWDRVHAAMRLWGSPWGAYLVLADARWSVVVYTEDVESCRQFLGPDAEGVTLQASTTSG